MLSIPHTRPYISGNMFKIKGGGVVGNTDMEVSAVLKTAAGITTICEGTNTGLGLAPNPQPPYQQT